MADTQEVEIIAVLGAQFRQELVLLDSQQIQVEAIPDSDARKRETEGDEDGQQALHHRSPPSAAAGSEMR